MHDRRRGRSDHGVDRVPAIRIEQARTTSTFSRDIDYSDEPHGFEGPVAVR